MREFQIPKADKTRNKTVRFPNSLILEIEEIIQGTDCSFSKFVVEATRVALENLKEKQKTGQETFLGEHHEKR